MPDAYLGLGSNLGDEAATLDEAVRSLDATPGIRVAARSSYYRTPPWGERDQPPFLNAALRVETSLAPRALLGACLVIERDLGRVRVRRWGPRHIDIDLIAYDDVAVSDGDLTLPHPRLFERAFVLVPLAEIAPDLLIGGRSVAAELALTDRSGIEIARPATERDG